MTRLPNRGSALCADREHARSGPVEVKVDEFPRRGSSVGSMSKLRPCFVKDSSGTVTAGNSSGLPPRFCESHLLHLEMEYLFSNLRYQRRGSGGCPDEPLGGREARRKTPGQNCVFSSSWPRPSRHGNGTDTRHQEGGESSGRQ